MLLESSVGRGREGVMIPHTPHPGEAEASSIPIPRGWPLCQGPGGKAQRFQGLGRGLISTLPAVSVAGVGRWERRVIAPVQCCPAEGLGEGALEAQLLPASPSCASGQTTTVGGGEEVRASHPLSSSLKSGCSQIITLLPSP